MRTGPTLLLLTLFAGALHAQDDATRNLQLREAEQRAWIVQTRARLEAQFRAQEIACYQRFAVNDCLADSRSDEREVMADLRRQEVLLNDAQRKRRGAQQLLRTDDKLSTKD